MNHNRLLLSSIVIFAFATVSFAQAPAPASGTTPSNNATTAESSKGAGLALLFSIQNKSLSPIAAASYDFADATGWFGIKTKYETTPGTPGDTSDPNSAITKARVNFLAKHPGYASFLTPNANSHLQAEIAPVVQTTGGFFSIVDSQKLISMQQALNIGLPMNALNTFDVNGNWVTPNGLLADPTTGRPLVNKQNVMVKTVAATDPNTNQPVTPAPEVKVKATEVFLSLLAGGSTSSGSSSASGGFGAGLRLSINGGNSSFFIGGWIDQLQFSSTHVAIGFTILGK